MDDKHSGPWAVVSQQNLPESVSIVHIDASNANARLIAAAPELLEACKKAIWWRNDYSSSAVDGQARELLLDAVSKAEKGGAMKPDKLDCGHPIDLTFSSTRHIQIRYSNSHGGIMISRAVISEVLVTEPNDEDQELVVTFKLVGEPEWANR